MSDRVEFVLVLVLANLAVLIAALAAWVQSRINSRKMDDLHHRVNSRLDQLLDVVAKSSRAEGRLERQDYPPWEPPP